MTAMLSRRALAGGITQLLAPARVRAAGTAAARIYAAMTFRTALDAVLDAYRERGGGAVAVLAPTPLLVRQIAEGATADILVTADAEWMDRAAAMDLIRPDTRVNLLANTLVLIGPAGTPSLGAIGRAAPLGALLGGGRLAMCDPYADPAGRFGRESLEALGLWDVARPRLAITETSLAAAALVERGEARAAIGFQTDVNGSKAAAIVGRFPADSHRPIVYPAALTRRAQEPQASAAFAFLRSPDALRIFEGFGYTPGSA
jgi:molybdate transport system substrate-binding protein